MKKIIINAYLLVRLTVVWTLRVLRAIPLVHGTKARFNVLLMLIISLLVLPRIRMRFAVVANLYQSLYHLLMGRPARVRVGETVFVLSDLGDLAIVSPHYEHWMKERPREGGVFIDVGAHVGKYALTYARIVGNDGLVIAIEADQKYYQCLLDAIKLNGFRNIVALNIAAWDKEATLRMYRGTHTPEKYSKYGYFEVEARPLDKVIPEYHAGNVSLIKIDVDGAEYEVLAGLVQTLKNQSPTLVVEVSAENMNKVEELVTTLGYGLYPIKQGFLGGYYVASRNTPHKSEVVSPG